MVSALLNDGSAPPWWPIVVIVTMIILGVLRYLRERQRQRTVVEIVRKRPDVRITVTEGRWRSKIDIVPANQDTAPIKEAAASLLHLTVLLLARLRGYGRE